MWQCHQESGRLQCFWGFMRVVLVRTSPVHQREAKICSEGWFCVFHCGFGMLHQCYRIALFTYLSVAAMMLLLPVAWVNRRLKSALGLQIYSEIFEDNIWYILAFQGQNESLSFHSTFFT